MDIFIYLFLCLFTYVYKCLTFSVLFFNISLWQEVPQSPWLWEQRLDSDLGLANQQLSLQITLYLGQRTQRQIFHYNLFTVTLSQSRISLLLGFWAPILLFTIFKTNLVSSEMSFQCHPAIDSCSSKTIGINSCFFVNQCRLTHLL